MPIKKGDKFNKLTAIEFSYKNKKYQQFWLFRCDCGKEKIMFVCNVKAGKSKSCGCLSGRNFKHKMSDTKTYRSWSGMLQRCLNKNNPRYKDYGKRGITVCKEWMKFENFYVDMGDCPQGKTLDRKDNDKGYCRDNCRWATRTEQMNNKRCNHLITYNNKTQTIAQWAIELNIKYNTLWRRIKVGWSIKKSLSN